MIQRVSERIHRVDVSLFRRLFAIKWPPLTALMRLLTLAGTAGALWGGIAAAGFVISGFHMPSLLVPWAAIALSWTIAEGIKHLFNRERPFVRDSGILPLIKTPSSSSFPSGHAATAAAGAVVLSVVYPVLAPVLLLAGVLTAFSRVYLGVHYPSDVAVGVIIGLVVTGTILLMLWM